MLCTTVSIHLESHDASPGLSEHPGQFPGTPSCLQSCKPTLHLREKKGREGGTRLERGRREEEGTQHMHNVVNYLKFNCKIYLPSEKYCMYSDRHMYTCT